jgi:hypothetical protein
VLDHSLTSLPQRAVDRLHRRAAMTHYAFSADGFLVSYPKSGRTWLRYLLAHYFAFLANCHEQIDLHNMFSIIPNFALDSERGIPGFRFLNDGNAVVPKIWVSHHNYHGSLFFSKPVIMMVRDPRDVIVSAYFHATRHKHRFEGVMADFIRDEFQGLPAMCRYLNGWARGIEGRRHLIVTYESLSAQTDVVLASVLGFLGCPIDLDAITASVAAGSFTSMREMELVEGIPGHEYDRGDSESLRMRRGVSSGYHDYLNDELVRVVEDICIRTLSPAAKATIAGTGMSMV